jgi:transcriptional regulator with XRE-family HTH domain
MERSGWSDQQVAEAIKLSRVQVNRLRRGVCVASTATALKLQKLTQIPWHRFIRDPVRKKRAA